MLRPGGWEHTACCRSFLPNQALAKHGLLIDMLDRQSEQQTTSICCKTQGGVRKVVSSIIGNLSVWLAGLLFGNLSPGGVRKVVSCTSVL